MLCYVMLSYMLCYVVSCNVMQLFRLNFLFLSPDSTFLMLWLVLGKHHVWLKTPVLVTTDC